MTQMEDRQKPIENGFVTTKKEKVGIIWAEFKSLARFLCYKDYEYRAEFFITFFTGFDSLARDLQYSKTENLKLENLQDYGQYFQDGLVR